MSFKNTILIIVFNYSNCVKNKNILKQIYHKHFKNIIFYSDIPKVETDCEDEINYISIDKGFFVYKIFPHFFEKYKELVEESEGVFYTMDDNIINVNLLNNFTSSKILYYFEKTNQLDVYSGWHWDRVHGKNAINNLLQDNSFKQYNIDKFCGAFSDWFYLPKKHINSALIELFKLFGKYDVFLEIAIPSIINNLMSNRSEYQIFNSRVLWSKDREKLLDEDYVMNSFNKDKQLIVHPIKFNENPKSKDWLKNLFCKDKCVIITTINKPTETILKHIKNDDYDLIIVGDLKTPSDYKDLNCIYLDVSKQKLFFPELSELIPYNHYCRKNLGYLYAILRGYKIIYETDDDNIPYDNFDEILKSYDIKNFNMITGTENRWINIFKYFTNNGYIWPRGFPLSLLKNNLVHQIKDSNFKKPSIINGLVENDPDVDALFRIICNHQNDIKWEKNIEILIDNNNICVFNTQNTFWTNPELFVSLIIPCSVSFRYCDILRGIISNIILKRTNNNMMYISPNVIQIRNEHNLISDFKSEYEMYINNENILNFLENDLNNKNNVKEIIKQIYKNLQNNNVIGKRDLEILDCWLNYF
jgi:hypothetical protein